MGYYVLNQNKRRKYKISPFSVIFRLFRGIAGGVIVLMAATSGAVIDETPFFSDSCVNGFANGWTNACVCPSGFSGALCTEVGTKTCGQTNDCPKDMYCNAGYCYPLTHYPPVSCKGYDLILSRALVTYDEAGDFCRRINGRGMARADFKCRSTGVGCLDKEKLVLLQRVVRSQGFVWLEALDSRQAYYADLNDGTIYVSDRKNRNYMQALCLVEVK